MSLVDATIPPVSKVNIAGVRRAMRGIKPVLLLVGLLLASLAESSGPLWYLAAAGSFTAFLFLLILSLRSAPERRAACAEQPDITIVLPPPFPLEERADDADRALVRNVKKAPASISSP
jgi:hypothetical protein